MNSLTSKERLVISLHESGWTQKAIGKHLKCSDNTVRAILKKVGRLKADQKVLLDNKILTLKSTGLDDKQVASIVGCTPAHITRVLRRNGIIRCKRDPKKRLEELIEKDPLTLCWNYQGYTVNGYGRMYTNGKPITTHRLAYTLFVGEIPPGQQVLHRCDNPQCCNPEHLFLGTTADNMRDRNQKGRQAKGERVGGAVLNAASSEKIRELRSQGWSYKRIAEFLNCSKTTVADVVKGRRWKSTLSS